jgi:hypothetical protein
MAAASPVPRRKTAATIPGVNPEGTGWTDQDHGHRQGELTRANFLPCNRFTSSKSPCLLGRPNPGKAI